VIKEKEIVNFSYKETVVDRFAKRIGASMAQSIGLDTLTKGMQLR
jgi:protease IV